MIFDDALIKAGLVSVKLFVLRRFFLFMLKYIPNDMRFRITSKICASLMGSRIKNVLITTVKCCLKAVSLNKCVIKTFT